MRMSVHLTIVLSNHKTNHTKTFIVMITQSELLVISQKYRDHENFPMIANVAQNYVLVSSDTLLL